MPYSAPRKCTQPGCKKLVHDGSGRCSEHARPKFAKSQPYQHKRITGRKLQQLRAELFARQPLCQICENEGRVTEATIRDHIKPLAEGGEDTEENTQAICAVCDKKKSRAEAVRGRWGG